MNFDVNLLAAIGDGNLIRFVLGIAIGCFIGWFIPAPAFIEKLKNRKP